MIPCRVHAPPLYGMGGDHHPTPHRIHRGDTQTYIYIHTNTPRTRVPPRGLSCYQLFRVCSAFVWVCLGFSSSFITYIQCTVYIYMCIYYTHYTHKHTHTTNVFFRRFSIAVFDEPKGHGDIMEVDTWGELIHLLLSISPYIAEKQALYIWQVPPIWVPGIATE